MLQNAERERKISLAYRIFLSHLNFSLSRKQRYEQHSWQIARNSRNSCVDLQSQRQQKREIEKSFFSLKAEMLYFD